MKKWMLLMVGAQAFTSCAYVQTHKNVEETFCRYEGACIAKTPELYRAGEQYLVAAEQCELSKHYPVVHDTVFINSELDPLFHVEQRTGKKVYYPLSAGTAQVLQREDGYATLPILRDEIQRHAPLTQLPRSARSCNVKAQLAEADMPNAELITGPRVPELLSPWVRVLSQTEQVLIDWPATLGYNCAIPLMAPFVFFHRFLNEE